MAAKTGTFNCSMSKEPLMSFISVDNVDEILSAIANKIDVDALGSDGRNALHWACTLHRTSICHILVKKGASLSKKDVRLTSTNFTIAAILFW